MMKPATQVKQQPVYETPRITHRGQLKQFAGSPLGGRPDGNPLGLPGQKTANENEKRACKNNFPTFG